MYTEKQHYQHQFLGYLQWLSAGLVLWQLIAFATLEAGIPILTFDATIQVFILFAAAALWLILANAHLSLRISTKGWDLRYFPFQLYHRHIAWEEIKNVCRVQKRNLPGNAPFGFPGKDFTRSYLLTNSRFEVLRIDLVTGAQIFVSSKNAEELLSFLQKGVFMSV